MPTSLRGSKVSVKLPLSKVSKVGAGGRLMIELDQMNHTAAMRRIKCRKQARFCFFQPNNILRSTDQDAPAQPWKRAACSHCRTILETARPFTALDAQLVIIRALSRVNLVWTSDTMPTLSGSVIPTMEKAGLLKLYHSLNVACCVAPAGLSASCKCSYPSQHQSHHCCSRSTDESGVCSTNPTPLLLDAVGQSLV